MFQILQIQRRYQIWDVGTPNSPTKLGSFDALLNASGVYVSSSYACVGDYDYGFQIYQFFGTGIEEQYEKEISFLRLMMKKAKR